MPAGVRERILEAALATLREHGLHKLTQVRVAERARVRQSHLTYYFPTREDLLGAMAERAVDDIARHGTGAAGAPGDRGATLAHIAAAVAAPAHMRMFVGLIVEADDDPVVRSMLVKGTEHMQATISEALGGGDDAAERAPLVLAALWGLGLYHLLVRPPSTADSTRSLLSWLGEVAQAPRAREGGRARNTPNAD